MSIEPRMILNGQDDVARRKMAKQILSDRVEASLDEFGLLNAVGHYAKQTIKKVLGMDHKKSDSSKEDPPKVTIAKTSKNSGFNEKDHPRGQDGRFTEEPSGSLGKGAAKIGEKAHEAEINRKEDELYNAQESKWEEDKAKWDADEISKANKKIKSINDGDLKKANSELSKAKDYLKRSDLSDDDVEKGSKKFQDANKKLKEIQAKILKINPAPYKEPKPVKTHKK